MSEATGRSGISSRIAFGALYIKAHCHLTDEETVQNLQENAYMQYFVGCGAARVSPGAVVRRIHDGAFPEAVSSGRGGEDQ